MPVPDPTPTTRSRSAVRQYIVGRTHGSVHPRSVGDLATEVAAYKHGVDTADVSESDEMRMRVGLQHIHLPALDDKGTIPYDRENGMVRPCEAAPLPIPK